MRLKQLDALEAKWVAGVFRVFFDSGNKRDCCPSLREHGVTLDEAMIIRDRIITIAPMKGIDVSSVHVIGPDGLSVTSANAARAINKPINAEPVELVDADVIKRKLNNKQLRGLSNLDNVDLALLVNPDALEQAGDIDDDQ